MPVLKNHGGAKFFGQFVNMPLENVKYLPMGEAHKLGTMDVSALGQERFKL